LPWLACAFAFGACPRADGGVRPGKVDVTSAATDAASTGAGALPFCGVGAALDASAPVARGRGVKTVTGGVTRAGVAAGEAPLTGGGAAPFFAAATPRPDTGVAFAALPAGVSSSTPLVVATGAASADAAVVASADFVEPSASLDAPVLAAPGDVRCCRRSLKWLDPRAGSAGAGAPKGACGPGVPDVDV